jgi:hypothetical protein
MKKIQNTLLTTLLASLSFAAFTASSANASPLLNSNFESSSVEQTWPTGWPQPASASWELEDGNRFLRLKSEEAGKMVMIYKEIQIPEGTEALQITWKQRVTGLIVGAQSWFDARLMMEFMDGNRLALSPKPKALATHSDTDGWVEKEQTITVPSDARILKFMPTLFQVTAGTLDLDDITVTPITSAAQ